MAKGMCALQIPARGPDLANEAAAGVPRARKTWTTFKTPSFKEMSFVDPNGLTLT